MDKALETSVRLLFNGLVPVFIVLLLTAILLHLAPAGDPYLAEVWFLALLAALPAWPWAFCRGNRFMWLERQHAVVWCHWSFSLIILVLVMLVIYTSATDHLCQLASRSARPDTQGQLVSVAFTDRFRVWLFGRQGRFVYVLTVGGSVLWLTANAIERYFKITDQRERARCAYERARAAVVVTEKDRHQEALQALEVRERLASVLKKELAVARLLEAQGASRTSTPALRLDPFEMRTQDQEAIRAKLQRWREEGMAECELERQRVLLERAAEVRYRRAIGEGE